jgi:1-phosphatidylinositol phosphodiesterase
LTTQDPQLGEVRGKILLLQEFNSLVIHGLLWATFSVLPNKKIGTNWDLYSKWLDIKGFMPGANAAKKSKIAFWTGHGGSYPYFVASGKSSPTGNRLLTGLTTPGFKSSYPDFPRIGCFIGICSICY